MEPIITTIFALCLPWLAMWYADINCEYPFYDTSEIWEIHYYDMLDVDVPCWGVDYPKTMTGACVRMWPDANGHYKIILGTNSIWQYQSLSSFEHEVLHLMCKCDYHGGGTLRG